MARPLPHSGLVETISGSVLIVDDDEDWRGMLADVLAEAGFFVTTASNGRAALALWGGARAQVVVTDVQMPVMDGYELFAALHSIDQALPIIVLSADGLDAAVSFAGAFRIIRKPASAEAVLSAVTEAFVRRPPPGRRRLADTTRALMSLGRAKSHAAIARTSSLLRPPENADRSAVRKRRRAGLAMAGLGAVAAVAVLIGTVRGLLA